MNYDLALNLKNAGFPQANPSYEGKDSWVDPENVHCNNIISDAIYCPTLEELIEACGKHFLHLENRSGHERMEYAWRAMARYTPTKDYVFDWILGAGETPSIAVANLWLELNKNMKNL